MSDKKIRETTVVKGYKVFDPDWTCDPTYINAKQYTCPGRFEEDLKPIVTKQGMHFCKNLTSCFSYYEFDPAKKVAEVAAYGDISEDGNLVCTNKLEIIRELSWYEVLDLVNEGKYCTGFNNSGDNNVGCNNNGCRNSGNVNNGDLNTGDGNCGDGNTGCNNTGNWNTGFCNSGNSNTGDDNVGNLNTGFCNSGNSNTGDDNVGDYNSGIKNFGHSNTGCQNIGNQNTGNKNIGHSNVGNNNAGNLNTGNYNLGNENTGIGNSGNNNTGDWNKSDGNTGCFNTKDQPLMMFFNKPYRITLDEWRRSKAYKILLTMPMLTFKDTELKKIEDEQKCDGPRKEQMCDYDYDKIKNEGSTSEIAYIRLQWWDNLNDCDKDVIRNIPNFDEDVFLKCICS